MSKDLVVLTADIQQEKTIEVLLRNRCHSLGIRPISFDIFRHPHRDAGVYFKAADFLALYLPPHYAHALVVLDREWDGAPGSADTIREDLLHQMWKTGWPVAACEVVVLDPELETWIWADSPVVPDVLRMSWTDIWTLAYRHEYWVAGQPKPVRPKELLETILSRQGRPHSSALFQEIARRVGLRSCVDPAFVLLRETLLSWFAASGNG